MKYMGSKSRLAKDIVPIIQSYIDNNNIENYLEPFCLGEETILFTENGIKTIKEVNIGDYIYDENCELKKIVQKQSVIKDGLYFKTKGNINISCSYDHPFYNEVDNSEVLAKNLLNIELKKGRDKRKQYKTLIDLKPYMTISNKKHGRSGKVIGDNIKLYHNAPLIPRYININEDLLYLYGWIVAEGDKSNITLNKKEFEIAKNIIEKYGKILNLDLSKNKIYTFNENKNSLQLSIPFKTIYEKLFFQALKIGYGARNKNISFLFDVEPRLVKVALKSMYTGDGCIMDKNGYKSLNYKTSSKTLAYQLQCLLSVKFGIKSTLSHGVNKERKIENRILKETDYYNISITNSKDIKILFDDLEDIKTNNNKYRGFVVKEIKPIQNFKFYDITLENNSTHKYIINGGIITHNCGGANVIDKIKCKNRYGSDNNEYLIALLTELSKGWIPNKIYTEQEYKDIKDNKEKYPNHIVGYVGFCLSFGAKFFGGFARK